MGLADSGVVWCAGGPVALREKGDYMAGHVALLGDSIFDNQVYTDGEPDVVTHLQTILPVDWRASLHAVDGATTGDIKSQCQDVPDDATHLIVSVGGNDAIMSSHLLGQQVEDIAQAMMVLGQSINGFESDYRAAVRAVLSLGRPTTLCTIYNGDFPPEQAPVNRVALMPFNDVILRAAFEYHLSVIDLRSICNEPTDYANPIEPSGHGGRKIAKAIARTIGSVGGEKGCARVYGG